jgi:uncharacterized membrane protein YidH (DUF202 family)
MTGEPARDEPTREEPTPDEPGRPPERDPGLQPERTRLAWQRTALGVLLSCAVIGLAGVRERDDVVVLASVLLAVLTAGAAVLTTTRGWLVARTTAWRLLLPTGLAVVALGLLGTVAAVKGMAG